MTNACSMLERPELHQPHHPSHSLRVQPSQFLADIPCTARPKKQQEVNGWFMARGMGLQIRRQTWRLQLWLALVRHCQSAALHLGSPAPAQLHGGQVSAIPAHSLRHRLHPSSHGTGRCHARSCTHVSCTMHAVRALHCFRLSVGCGCLCHR